MARATPSGKKIVSARTVAPFLTRVLMSPQLWHMCQPACAIRQCGRQKELQVHSAGSRFTYRHRRTASTCRFRPGFCRAAPSEREARVNSQELCVTTSCSSSSSEYHRAGSGSRKVLITHLCARIGVMAPRWSPVGNASSQCVMAIFAATAPQHVAFWAAATSLSHAARCAALETWQFTFWHLHLCASQQEVSACIIG